MTATTYTRFELARTFRNRRFFIFTLAFPLILFLTVAGGTGTTRWGAYRSPCTTWRAWWPGAPWAR